MDVRLQKLAKVLVNYSLGIKPGNLFKISAEPVAEPLVLAVYEQALKIGAYPTIELGLIDTRELLLKYGNDEQLLYLSPIRKLEVEELNAQLTIWATTNTKFLSNADPKRQQLLSRGGRPYLQRFFERVGQKSLKWCGTQYPTAAHAQDAEMSLREYEDFVYQGGHVHEDDPLVYWRKVEKEQDRLVQILNQAEKIHLRAEDTDLTLLVKDRKWVNCCGHENFPDGEIFTSPIENSVNGTIKFTFPAFYMGREVVGVRMKVQRRYRG